MNGKQGKPPAPGSEWMLWIWLGLGALASVYLMLQTVSFLDTGSFVGGNPIARSIEWVGDLFKGRSQWTATHTLAAVVVGTLIAAIAITLFLRAYLRPPETGTKAKARKLSKGSELSQKKTAERAEKGRLTTGESKGVLLVKTLHGAAERFAGWRDTIVLIAGPGWGKTVGEAVPIVMDAPGVVYITSNKRDIADAIRGARKGRMWVFDPQQITSKSDPGWYWDPLSYILRSDTGAADEVRAHKLAKVWMDASGPVNAKRDSYFDTAGPNLLAGLLLAAALDHKPVSQVFLWLTKQRNQRPVQILTEHGYLLPAAALEGVYNDPDEQRAGVFGTAAEMVSFLNNSRVRSWVEPAPGRVEFSPEQFVRSADETMISLSKEGIGSTGPLTASLTIAVLDAAEDLADLHPHGRLPIPLTVMLDEAANVCRIRDLPSLYSHYGSRGIFPTTIIQNWAQGENAWGKEGMMQLWGAATIRIVGGGQADTTHLKSVSDLLGQHEVMKYSTSSASGRSRSYTRSATPTKEPVMDVDDLAALKPGECVVHFAGGRPFLGQTVPWFERPEMKELVSASIAKYEPS